MQKELCHRASEREIKEEIHGRELPRDSHNREWELDAATIVDGEDHMWDALTKHHWYALNEKQHEDEWCYLWQLPVKVSCMLGTLLLWLMLELDKTRIRAYAKLQFINYAWKRLLDLHHPKDDLAQVCT